MIEFIEHSEPGYPSRTARNIIDSETTIAIASDFTSRGEVLTKKLCKTYGSPYFPIDYNNKDMRNDRWQKLADRLNDKGITSINGAGNGIYTLQQSQKEVTLFILFMLQHLDHLLTKQITEIRSGGQTGIDEGFLKAADEFGIPSVICLAPFGWKFRDINGNDISDEKLFKQRFI